MHGGWVMIKALISIIFLSLSFVCGAVAPGSYDHVKKQAYIVVRDKDQYDEKQVYRIDFESGSTEVLSSVAYIQNLAVSPNGKHLAYHTRDKIIIFDLIKNKELVSMSGEFTRGVFWSDDGIFLTSLNKKNNSFILYNVAEETYVYLEKETKSKMIMDVVWNSETKEFYYYIFNKDLTSTRSPNSGAATMYKQEKDVLVPTKKVLIGQSPDAKYRYDVSTESEQGTYLLIWAGGDEPQIYDTSTILGASIRKMWGKDTLRILEWQGLVNIKTKSLFKGFDHYVWESGKHAAGRARYRDVAAEFEDYVLMYDNQEKVYVVQDINSGKIVERFDTVKLAPR